MSCMRRLGSLTCVCVSSAACVRANRAPPATAAGRDDSGTGAQRPRGGRAAGRRQAILADAVAGHGRRRGVASAQDGRTSSGRPTSRGWGSAAPGERFADPRRQVADRHGDLTGARQDPRGDQRQGRPGPRIRCMGLRYPRGAPRRSRRAIDSSWNAEHARGGAVREARVRDPRARAGRDALECVIATPKLGAPMTQLLRRRAPTSRCSQQERRASPQGDVPFRATLGATGARWAA